MKLLTLARDLHRRRARERIGLFLAEGVRTVEELLASELSIRGALVSPSLRSTERGAELADRLAQNASSIGYEVAEVTDRDLRTVSDTESQQGILVIAACPERSFDSIPTRLPIRLLVLDGIQDPGNVGTILRTAEAFGVSSTVALAGTVDLWNPKVVRSAMGAIFRQHAFASSREDLLAYCRAKQVKLLATSAAGEVLEPGFGAQERLAIVVGNEGSGVSDALIQAADRNVSIPIRGIESLNVAVATGIILYALRHE